MLAVRGAGGAAVDVEGHPEAGEGVADDAVVAVDDVLRTDTLLLGLDRHGHAVLVTARDEEHLLALEPEVAGVDVGRDVDPCEVPDVYGAVGIG